MSVSTTPMLVDIGLHRIKQIVVVWINQDGPVTRYMKTPWEIASFTQDNPVEVQWLDGLWCSVKPENGWLNFHVELKP